jgi:hypothetical protein
MESGAKKAKELKSKTATSRKSLGMQLTESRLGLLNKYAQVNASVEIIGFAEWRVKKHWEQKLF